MEFDRRWMPDPSYPGSVRGKLLVAGPSLRDPNFDRSVVVILEHSQHGAFGLILNRRVTVRVGELLPSWRSPDDHAFQGGPVEPQSGLGLGLVLPTVALPPPPEARPLLGSLYAVGLNAGGEVLNELFGSMRIYLGYAGWSPGQLDAEIDDFGWIVVDGSESDVFHGDPDRQWHDVLARQPGELRHLRHYPTDPALN